MSSHYSPEALKHHLSGKCSRKTDKVNRFIYNIENNEPHIYSLKGHYEQKQLIYELPLLFLVVLRLIFAGAKSETFAQPARQRYLLFEELGFPNPLKHQGVSKDFFYLKTNIPDSPKKQIENHHKNPYFYTFNQ